ncbi:MAG TPA: mechanosensitive ion channel family protein [Gaiellaceae bacterium]|nr:mechanosensitive ion channel family protein [Gaiellaceae bacterium]
MSDRTIDLLLSLGVGAAAVLLVRWVLTRAYVQLERRRPGSDPADVARRRTTWLFVQRVIVALTAGVAAWNVLSVFEVTQSLGRALLASSAVVAVFAGLAFNTPLSNLGSGLLVAFAQPLRLGDRVTIAEHTGFVEEMSLLYTTLVTDDARRIFIPNSQLTSTTIVNRTIRDPRRSVIATFPLPVRAPLDRALAVLAEAVKAVPGLTGDPRVLVGSVADSGVTVEVTAYAPLDADVNVLASRVREAGLRALLETGLLAA